MSRQLLFTDEARKSLLHGIEKLAKAVKATLGPQGRMVLLEKTAGVGSITKDGVTVAREIMLKDPFENLGAQMIRDVASKTNDISGDGTTTATVLAEAIFKEGMKNIVTGCNPVEIKRGIDKAVTVVVEKLKELAKPVNGSDDIMKIATISSNGDEAIGNYIKDAMEKVGKDGIVTVEEGKSRDTTLEVVEGMQFESGYFSAHFLHDQSKQDITLENPYILVYDKKIESLPTFVPLLEKVLKSQKPLLIIAEDISNEVLATLVVNNMRGTFRNCFVKPPSFGNNRKEMLEDIAILTGGKVISLELGMKLEGVELEDLGQAKKVVITKQNTTIVDGHGSKEAIDNRVNSLKVSLETEVSDFNKEKMKERLAKLSGGVAVISVGGTTEVEILEKKDRVEDALQATRAAIEEGVVPGGGVAFLRAVDVLNTVQTERDEKIGVNIVRFALEAPLRQIAVNSGLEGSVVLERVKDKADDYGYNARTNLYGNLIEMGVIDPVKVLRVGLENAASIAGLLLITECVISIEREEKKT